MSPITPEMVKEAGVMDAVKKARDTVKDGVRKKVQGAKDRLRSAAEESRPKAQKIMDKVEQKMDSVGDSIRITKDQVKEKLGNTVKKTKKRVDDTVGQVKQKVEDIKNTPDNIQQAVSDMSAATVNNAMGQAARTIYPYARNAAIGGLIGSVGGGALGGYAADNPYVGIPMGAILGGIGGSAAGLSGTGIYNMRRMM